MTTRAHTLAALALLAVAGCASGRPAVRYPADPDRWSGLWETDSGPLVLLQQDATVTGFYATGTGIYEIEGRIQRDGTILYRERAVSRDFPPGEHVLHPVGDGHSRFHFANPYGTWDGRRIAGLPSDAPGTKPRWSGLLKTEGGFIELAQWGSKVSGSYAHGPAMAGILRGFAHGGTVDAVWREGDSYGWVNIAPAETEGAVRVRIWPVKGTSAMGAGFAGTWGPAEWGIAAACTDAAGCYSLAGPAFLFGRALARDLYTKACAFGEKQACPLADAIRVLAVDEGKGEQALAASCDNGIGPACCYLAKLDKDTTLVEGDPRYSPRARQLYEKGCQLGDYFTSCIELGMSLWRGSFGEKDLVGAEAALRRGCEGGARIACGHLENLRKGSAPP